MSGLLEREINGEIVLYVGRTWMEIYFKGWV